MNVSSGGTTVSAHFLRPLAPLRKGDRFASEVSQTLGLLSSAFHLLLKVSQAPSSSSPRARDGRL